LLKNPAPSHGAKANTKLPESPFSFLGEFFLLRVPLLPNLFLFSLRCSFSSFFFVLPTLFFVSQKNNSFLPIFSFLSPVLNKSHIHEIMTPLFQSPGRAHSSSARPVHQFRLTEFIN